MRTIFIFLGFSLMLSSHGFSQADHHDHDEDGHVHHDHHKNEIGMANGAVYFVGEKEFS